MELPGAPALSISTSKSFLRLFHPIHSTIHNSRTYRRPKSVSLCHARTSAAATSATAPTAGLESRKDDLLRAVQETQRGLSATADQRSYIEEALVSLEGFGAGLPVDLVSLDGTWRLNYTSAADVLFLFEAAARLPFFQVGQIFQKFECHDGKNGGLVRNVVRWSIPTLLEEQGATLLVTAKFSVLTKRNIYLQFEEVAARAKYCIEYGATNPNIFLPCEIIKSPAIEGVSIGASNKLSFSHLQREWKLYMPKAYHPLLLQQYRENLENAKKALTDVASDIRRKKMQGKDLITKDINSHLEHMKVRVLQMERCAPVPVDFAISAETTVLVITGPNTGGKTISLKTIGLASLMSKAGLYVLASEPAKLPWFDAVYADIGDEQSLTQSLSTFSGHLKQISAIRSNSTCHSLVLLDEVGAGTNPLEGAALGMSLLESFAESGSYLTIATTHHGELKELKYSNDTFENACVEFDEESLKPTYRVLWGIPGRSNAIHIAEKIGLSHAILSNATKLHGKSSAEINQIIMDLENCKQEFEHYLQEAQDYLILSRKLHQDLLLTRERIAKHCSSEKTRKAKSISDIAAIAHSVLRTKLQQYRESASPQSTSQNVGARDSEPPKQDLNMMASAKDSVEQTQGSEINKPSKEKPFKMPEVGDTVFVPSIRKEAVVLQVLPSKGVLVQAANIKLRLRLKEIVPGL